MNKKANYIELHGLQYHLGCKPGDFANKILLVGDPDRATKVAAHFSNVRVQRQHREFFTYTGQYKDQDMTVMSTGIGEGNMEISIIEISQLVENPKIIRCGSCSAIEKDIALGSLVISQRSIELGSVCSYYNIDLNQLIASPKLTQSLENACKEMGFEHTTGITASAPGFYGPQGRHIKGFPIKKPHLIDELQKQGVKNLEMEIATLFGLSSLKQIEAGAICAVYGNRASDTFLSEQEMPEAESRCIEASLLALHQIVV